MGSILALFDTSSTPSNLYRVWTLGTEFLVKLCLLLSGNPNDETLMSERMKEGKYEEKKNGDHAFLI